MQSFGGGVGAELKQSGLIFSTSPCQNNGACAPFDVFGIAFSPLYRPRDLGFRAKPFGFPLCCVATLTRS